MFDPIWDNPRLLTFFSSYLGGEEGGIRPIVVPHHIAESFVARRCDVRKVHKSSFEAASSPAGQAAVENLRILIADAARCSDYDLVNRLERILKKVEVLVHNLEAAGRGDTPRMSATKQAPFQASKLGGAAPRPLGFPDPGDSDRLASLKADQAARPRLPGKPRSSH